MSFLFALRAIAMSSKEDLTPESRDTDALTRAQVDEEGLGVILR